jgi:hypothetical protein
MSGMVSISSVSINNLADIFILRLKKGDTFDWNIAPGGSAPTATIEANYASLFSKGASPAAETGGVIVLDHELTTPDMNMAIQEYPLIKQSWKYIVPLTACLNVTQPYAEDIIYPNFAQYIGGSTMPSGLPTTAPTIASASVIPQGTLSSMGSLMNTNQAGGPQTPLVSYSLTFSSTPTLIPASATNTGVGNTNIEKGGSTSGATAFTWKGPIASLGGTTISAFIFYFFL